MLLIMTKRYQRMAIALYASVWVATLFYVLARAGNSPPGGGGDRGDFLDLPLLWSVGINTTLFLILILLENQLSKTPFAELSRRQAMLQLGIRFLLITLSVVISRVPFTMYLFYPIFLFAFFAFGRKVAFGAAIGTSLFVMGYVTTFSQQTLFSPLDINNLFVFLLGTLMVLLLANALQQERETGFHLQQAHDELGQSHTQLQLYAAQVATLAATDERNRLARDIHDSLGHHLAATSIQLEKAAAYSERDKGKSAEALNHARRTIREALGEVRTSVRALREPKVGFELTSALDELSKRMGHHDLDIRLNVSGDSDPYPVFAQMTLYRIIQEGLTNIHKHAYANQATIDLCFSDRMATLKISDNGTGFIHKNGGITELENGGLGLQGIQERVALVGGDYDVQSQLQKGTVLSVTIPKSSETKEYRIVE